MQDVTRIRYFGRLIDPLEVCKGFGWVFLVVRLLNLIRVWSERKLVLITVKNYLVSQGMRGKALKVTLKECEEDPFFRPGNAHSIVERAPRSLLRDRLVKKDSSQEVKAQERYGAGRKNVEEDPDRPISIEDGLAATFSVTARKKDRSARYVIGREHKVLNVDGDFDEVV